MFLCHCCFFFSEIGCEPSKSGGMGVGLFVFHVFLSKMSRTIPVPRVGVPHLFILPFHLCPNVDLECPPVRVQRFFSCCCFCSHFYTAFFEEEKYGTRWAVTAALIEVKFICVHDFSVVSSF